MRRESVFRVVGVIVATALATRVSAPGQVAKAPVDPGVRGGAAGGGSPLGGLTQDEQAFFDELKTLMRNRSSGPGIQSSDSRGSGAAGSGPGEENQETGVED